MHACRVRPICGIFNQTTSDWSNNTTPFPPPITGRISSSGFQCLRSNTSDDRCRTSLSTADPFDGRYSAQMNLASSTPELMVLPLHPSLPRDPDTRFRLDLSLRSSPPGVLATVVTQGGLEVGSVHVMSLFNSGLCGVLVLDLTQGTVLGSRFSCI